MLNCSDRFFDIFFKSWKFRFHFTNWSVSPSGYDVRKIHRHDEYILWNTGKFLFFDVFLAPWTINITHTHFEFSLGRPLSEMCDDLTTTRNAVGFASTNIFRVGSAFFDLCSVYLSPLYIYISFSLLFSF